jgi:hypothetical protein
MLRCVQVVFVDLDKNEIYVPSLDAVPSLPERDAKKLLGHLKKHANLYNPKAPAPASLLKADLAFPQGIGPPPLSAVFMCLCV